MSLRGEIRIFLLIVAIFLAFYYVPLESERVSGAVIEALGLVQWYAREHMLFGLLPAFFIAGAIAAFISKSAVMRYLGARAKRHVAYAVASVSGSILAVCSCTILPLFAGIYSRGAGLGPATAFLYAGPAINVMAIILTARVLGPQIGVARAVGAITFSIVIGLIMHAIFRRDEAARTEETLSAPEPEIDRPLGHSLTFFAALILLIAFANLGESVSGAGFWHAAYSVKWLLTGAAAALIAVLLGTWFRLKTWHLIAAAIPVAVLAALRVGAPIVPFIVGVAGMTVVSALGTRETREWIEGSWGFAKDILPLLLVGILVVGALLGRPDHEGLIPTAWVVRLVGGNSILSNFVAAVASGFMYFCTLTEVPIVQGLMGSGMGKGPALAFLLAGPAVSLPNILVLRSIVGTRKTLVYLALVLLMATGTGLVFGLMTE